MKLLSPKPFEAFTAEDYHTYIKSLNKPRAFTSTKKEQKDLKVRVKVKKDGSLSIVTKRSPPYLTEKELIKISEETKIPQNVLYLGLKERGFVITKDHKEAAMRLSTSPS